MGTFSDGFTVVAAAVVINFIYSSYYCHGNRAMEPHKGEEDSWGEGLSEE